MANLTFQDELDNLLELVKFKSFVRYGNALYAEHCGVLRPECTVSEMVWGWCRNPVFAQRLIRSVMAEVPDYPKVLGRSNHDISSAVIADSFDLAMAMVCQRNGQAPVLAYSIESTNSNDHVYEECVEDKPSHYVRVLNATEDDGELWHGLLVADAEWAKNVEHVTVSINGKNGNLLWQYRFSGASVAKRINVRNDVTLFQPFKHPLPLLDLDISIRTIVVFKPAATDVDALQVFGIGCDGFCNWLQQSRFEVKLCKKSTARVDMKNRQISFQ